MNRQKVVYYGADWCADCQMAISFFKKHKIRYESHNIDIESGAKNTMLKITNGNSAIPTIIIGDKIMQEPTAVDLSNALLNQKSFKTKEVNDVITIGAGPTALATAIYTTREDIDTVLYEKAVIGGLAATTDWVDNYPGFPEGISGLDLAENLRKQAERFGAKIEIGEVSHITREGNLVKLETTDGDKYAKAVLIATGSDYKRLGIPGEAEYYTRGVHYCATCDGAFYRDKKIAVVGGGNSAVQEALFLTRFSSHIDLLVRSNEFRASDILLHELQKNNKITVRMNTTTDEIMGDGKLVNKVICTDKLTNKKIEFNVDGVFVFVGLKPNTEFLKGQIDLDEIGFIKTDDNLQTSMKGVYAAGDVRSGATMQIASAVGEGATAALRIREYLERPGIEW